MDPKEPGSLSDHRIESVVEHPYIGFLVAMPIFGSIADYSDDKKYRND